MKQILRALSVGLPAACCACSEQEPPSDPPVPIAAPAAPDVSSGFAPASGEQEARVSGFRFTLPPGWRQAELSPEQRGFVDARFEIADYDDDVRLTMSTTGGGIEANIQRWLGQFQQPPGSAPRQETLEVNGRDVTWVDVSGDYQGMGGPVQSDWRMLAAAFHGQPRDFYVKLTGPATAIAELEAPFRALIESARAEE